MPLYEYRDTLTGNTLEMVKSVASRDRVPARFRRLRVPRRISVMAGVLDPTTPDRAVPKALKDLEQTLNHREIARQSGFSTAQLKRIWNV